MVSYGFLFLFLSHLASFLLFHGNPVTADTGLIDKVCKRYTDYQFCVSNFNLDSRSATADLRGLGKIIIQLTLSQVQETLNNYVPVIRRNIGHGDAIGLQRLNVCQSDYEAAYQKFGGAFQSIEKSGYWDVINWVRDGTNLVIDCQNIYRRSEPTAESPIAAINQRVFNLAGVILTVNDMLMGTE